MEMRKAYMQPVTTKQISVIYKP